MLSVEQAKALAKKQLSAKRYRHEKNVAKAACKLAVHYGVDAEKAKLAAWLHDIVKEWGQEELLQLLQQDAIMAGETKQRPLPIWHGPCAAIYAKHQLGLCDEELFSALACHTTGKVDMSLFDKIIFIADVISDERTFPGVEKLRKLAYEDLDEAVLIAMEENIAHVEKRQKLLDEETVRAYESMKEKRLCLLKESVTGGISI